MYRSYGDECGTVRRGPQQRAAATPHLHGAKRPHANKCPVGSASAPLLSLPPHLSLCHSASGTRPRLPPAPPTVLAREGEREREAHCSSVKRERKRHFHRARASESFRARTGHLKRTEMPRRRRAALYFSFVLQPACFPFSIPLYFHFHFLSLSLALDGSLLSDAEQKGRQRRREQ